MVPQTLMLWLPIAVLAVAALVVARQASEAQRRFADDLARLRRDVERMRAQFDQLHASPGERSGEVEVEPERADVVQESPAAPTVEDRAAPVEPERLEPITGPAIEARDVLAKDAATGPPPRRPRPAPPAPPAPPASPAPPGLRGGAGPSFETRVGTAWTLRAGLALLAIAAALFARTVLPALGPGAKVALAYTGSLALFGVGRVFEKKLERFARPVMAGGLALAFFVSYAAHFVSPMRVLPLVPALIWMAVGVAAILFVAERWASQPTAGLAVFLGHVAAFVAAGQADSFSLSVIVFLSGTAVVLFARHEWLPLSLFAVAAAYLSHLLWTLAHRDTLPTTDAFWINVAFLTSYYLIFSVADLIWQRRCHRAAPGTVSDRRRVLGGVLAPANLVFYMALGSYLFLVTPAVREEIEWFFFGIAAVEGVLYLTRRSIGIRGDVFFPAAAVILVTIGLYAAFETITLNIVLAAEALVLLLAAHRTGLWAFHLLAQLVLGANFVQYWFASEATMPSTPAYVGGLLVVTVYFVKAVLEERWYTAGGRPWEIGVGGEPIGRWFATTARRVFAPIAPYLGRLHAALGAVLVTHVNQQYFEGAGAVYAVGAILVAGASFALGLSSRALMVGYLVMQVGAWALVDDRAVQLPGWGAWIVATAGFGMALAVVVVGARRPALGSGTAVGWFSQLGVWAAAGTAFAALTGPEPTVLLFPLWLGAIALVFVHQARLTALTTKTADGATGAGPWTLPGQVTGLVTGVLMFWLTLRTWELSVEAPVWLISLSAVTAAALWFRSLPSLSFAAGTLFAFTYLTLPFVGLGSGPPITENAPASLWIVGVSLVLAVGRDRMQTASPDPAGVWSQLVVYGPAFALWAVFLDRWWAFPWPIVGGAVLAVALEGVAVRWRFRGGMTASLGWLVVLLLWFLVEIWPGPDPEITVLLPSVLFAALLVAAERLAARAVGSELLGGARVGGPLIVSAAIVALSAFTRAATWSTAGWSVTGAVLMGLGFAWRSSPYRRTALVVLALSLVRVFVVDLRDLSDTAKTLAFFTLGVVLILVAWLYARFTADVKRWL